jgi:hypothetical protein
VAQLHVQSSTAKAPTAQLLRSLGQVVRGLSTLFWGLPLTWVVFVGTAKTDWLVRLGACAFVPAVVLSAIVCRALGQLRDFQRQERIWQAALDRAELFAILNTGLTPFLYWWHKLPAVPLYRACVGLLLISSFLLLVQINYVLQRLSAMLPDEMLRMEAKMFTALNIFMLLAAMAVWSFYFALRQWQLPPSVTEPLESLDSPQGRWLMLFLALVPAAMTLSLIWKTKEVIFVSLISAER